MRESAYRPIWTLYVCTGMRHSQLVYMRWRDIDLTRRMVRLERRYLDMTKLADEAQ